MIKRIDHIAIAVANLDEAVGLFERVLGLALTRRESVAGYDVETATFELGGMAVELVAGTSAESTIRKFVETKGPGFHHIAFEVEDIEEAIAALAGKGIRLIDPIPRSGKDGSRVAFVHPESTGRVLCELVEPSDAE